MKNLIRDIIRENELSLIEFEQDDFFYFLAYFEKGKDDFYLFLFTTYSSILELSESVLGIEYTLNAAIGHLKKNELKRFNDRSIARNISLIAVVDDEGNEVDQNIFRVEENYNNGKKYVLNYNQDNLRILEERLEGTERTCDAINELIKENNSLFLSDDENGWYLFLLRLMIKIPFLNYEVLKEEKQNLLNLRSVIEARLDNNELNLVKSILEYDEEEIEEFLITNGLLNQNNE